MQMPSNERLLHSTVQVYGPESWQDVGPSEKSTSWSKKSISIVATMAILGLVAVGVHAYSSNAVSLRVLSQASVVNSVPTNMRAHQHSARVSLSPPVRPRQMRAVEAKGLPSKQDLKAGLAPVVGSLSTLTIPGVAQAAESMSTDNTWSELTLHAAKVAISWGLPVIVISLAVLVLAKVAKNDDSDSLSEKVGSENGGKSLPEALGLIKPQVAGKPKEYLKLERINDRYDSYAFSMQAATGGQKEALDVSRGRALAKKFGDRFGVLDKEKLDLVLKAEKEYLDEVQKLQTKAEKKKQNFLIKTLKVAEDMDNVKLLEGLKDGKDAGVIGNDLADIYSKTLAAEGKFLLEVGNILNKTDRENLLKFLKETPPKMLATGPAQPPLAINYDASNSQSKPHTFVVKFFGDIQASQVSSLREEVTGIIGSAKKERGDGVIVILNSGGGTVTGYGLAAAQLARIKAAGLKLTICVEQVAASGGYMMACTADRLVASPFATLGSIGVITEQPNVYERLQREGIEFTTVTAGQYKRTLTPFKKFDELDYAKSKEDIQSVFQLFKAFVAQNRPQLDIEKVATGEVWFGQDALDRQLCDELLSSDDVIIDLVKQGHEVYSVTFKPPQTGPLGLFPQTANIGNKDDAIRWWQTRLLEFVSGQAPGSMDGPRSPRIMAQDPNEPPMFM